MLKFLSCSQMHMSFPHHTVRVCAKRVNAQEVTLANHLQLRVQEINVVLSRMLNLSRVKRLPIECRTICHLNRDVYNSMTRDIA
jgi:hypothetical protein